VFILKVVRGFCFDILLQVFIPKVVRGGLWDRQGDRTKAKTKDNARSRLPAQLGTSSVKRRRGREGFAEVAPPRVFWEKRLQAVENKEQEPEKENKEAAGD
jgi:hypothetical protein